MMLHSLHDTKLVLCIPDSKDYEFCVFMQSHNKFWEICMAYTTTMPVASFSNVSPVSYSHRRTSVKGGKSRMTQHKKNGSAQLPQIFSLIYLFRNYLIIVQVQLLCTAWQCMIVWKRQNQSSYFSTPSWHCLEGLTTFTNSKSITWLKSQSGNYRHITDAIPCSVCVSPPWLRYVQPETYYTDSNKFIYIFLHYIPHHMQVKNIF
jgi:hypothetical protein